MKSQPNQKMGALQDKLLAFPNKSHLHTKAAVPATIRALQAVTAQHEQSFDFRKQIPPLWNTQRI